MLFFYYVTLKMTPFHSALTYSVSACYSSLLKVKYVLPNEIISQKKQRRRMQHHMHYFLLKSTINIRYSVGNTAGEFLYKVKFNQCLDLPMSDD